MMKSSQLFALISYCCIIITFVPIQRKWGGQNSAISMVQLYCRVATVLLQGAKARERRKNFWNCEARPCNSLREDALDAAALKPSASIRELCAFSARAQLVLSPFFHFLSVSHMPPTMEPSLTMLRSFW